MNNLLQCLASPFQSAGHLLTHACRNTHKKLVNGHTVITNVKQQCLCAEKCIDVHLGECECEC